MTDHPHADRAALDRLTAARDAVAAPRLSRRAVLGAALATPAAGLLWPAAARAQTPDPAVLTLAEPPTPERARAMTDQGARLVTALRADAAGSRALFARDDAERLRWHWTSPRFFRRNGAPLRDLGPTARATALELLEASLSPAGFAKAEAIRDTQTEIPGGGDPLMFFVSVFGQPGDGVWAWRFEGHHLSHHFLVSGDRVAAAPYFQGARPTEMRSGFRAMPREEDAARELFTGLNAEEQAAVRFAERALSRHVSGRQAFVTPPERVGAEIGRLGGDARARAEELIDLYLASLPLEHAAWRRARIDAEQGGAGVDAVSFGWSGSVAPGQSHHYRLQGESFLLEFDNSRNSGTHIHSVWRDYAHDFGGRGA